MVQAFDHYDPVGDLQARLSEAVAPDAVPSMSATRVEPPLSRTAHLHLTNLLARQFTLCFGVILLASFYVAVPDLWAMEPASVIWLSMVAIALSFLARRGFGYRSGQHRIASRPLRWRAHHRAAMGVLGVILACGPFLLTGSGAPSLTPVWVLGGAGAITALLQASDRNTCMRFILPILVGTFVYGISMDVTSLLFIVGMVIMSAGIVGTLFVMANRAEHRARMAYPPSRLRLAAENIASLRPVRVHRNIVPQPVQPDTARTG
ncbi:MAG: hypothetical protein AAFR20_07720 [Pseudomonadota bacterium]